LSKKPFFFFIILFILYSLTFGQKELLGTLTTEEILKNCPDWEEEVFSYWPNQEIIDKLKSFSHQVKIEIFLRTWCPDSKRNVSAYFKIIEMANNPLLQTTYIGLPKAKESRQEYIKGKSIDKIPTFIIFVDNQEKGRIIENPTKSIEEDLLEIINR